ncbi:hypothetical protein [Caniella muris]|uniref:hypothetical protein n=1 Tax=Caniella muris TaxID=2941502 RepID=UPI00203FF145|nr:hypothetical protein [Caniella muris]
MRARGACAATAALLLALASFPKGARALDASAVYRGGDGFAADTAQLTDAFGRAVPGDAQGGTVTLENGADAPVEVTLWAEPADPASEGLLEEARLTVSREGGGELFSGPLASEGLATPVGLGTVGPGETVGVSFTLSLDAVVGNGAALKEGDVLLVLCAQESGAAGAGGRAGSVARTGDVPAAGLGALLAASCAAAAATLFVRPRKEGKP